MNDSFFVEETETEGERERERWGSREEVGDSGRESEAEIKRQNKSG